MEKLNASEIAELLDNDGEYHPMRDDNLVEYIEKCLKHITFIADTVHDKTNKKNKKVLKLTKGLVRKISYSVNLMSINYSDKVREVEGRERTFAVLKEDINKARLKEKVIREEMHKVIEMQIKERLSEAYDSGFHSAQDYGEDNDY